MNVDMEVSVGSSSYLLHFILPRATLPHPLNNISCRGDPLVVMATTPAGGSFICIAMNVDVEVSVGSSSYLLHFILPRATALLHPLNNISCRGDPLVVMATTPAGESLSS
ncbi:hypothetical protein ACOMHN_006776 [Nucella lapillus]